MLLYFILAHNSANQVINLINKLNHPGTSFVIHYDLNSEDAEFNILVEYFKAQNNVHFTNRIKCYWGDFSLVNATINCMITARDLNINFDYASLISGQHYPIKSNEYIMNFLNESNGQNYINFFELPSANWANQSGGLDRILYLHFNKHSRKKYSARKLLNKGTSYVLRSLNIKRKLPFEKFYGGSQWWCITKETCDYIIEFIIANKNSYEFFRYVLIPDELFFQTLILNSKKSFKIVNRNLNFIEWKTNISPSPEILNINHLEKILESSNLWGRKFDMDESEELMIELKKEEEKKKNV
ncbi:beta-1,6-N-acetylglucosaminyltransferase [Rossellomorea marisflavi]|uniref:Peptide O-xylosyltransferase n=1 Tax=Rossellomorea marisflavi TaxID=189381 RepID=A0A161T3M5_9BACI|nr:beta-1,6-N-acetylglucosaminyltransferase [Rossellomorea marisflavi]KZE43900.1 hypothetical protein AV649_08640 [Rossellomorea marisflavi]